MGAGELLVRFVDGLDHRVGEQNRGISGGETRLIALARALIRKSSILLLDEPTASLDRDSENRFLQALSTLAHDKTVLMVAHRAELKAFAQQLIEVTPAKAEVAVEAAESTAQAESAAAAESAAQAASSDTAKEG